LLKGFGWDISKVKRHKDFSGKNCPHKTMELGWQRFLDMVQAELDKLNGKETTTTQPTTQPTQSTTGNKVNQETFKVKILQTLNIRPTPSWSGKVLGQVHKHEVYTIVEEYDNGFGKLKSGAGYIPIGKEFVEEVGQTTTTSSYRIKVVNCTTLNARQEPNGKIVQTVRCGTILTIVDEYQGWLKTKSGLWIAKTYTQRLDG
jgi:N-acetylmuramoyl-L-alanine amidase